MNNYGFKSIFKKELYNFIQFKRSCGYKYDNEVFECKKIDKYWYELNTNKMELIKEDVLAYTKRKNNESVAYLKNRIYVIKHFALFLIKQGYKNIYVYEYPIKQNKYQYVPYIYTEEDFITFINAVSKSNLRDKNKYILLFELLYCTGMRLSEVTHIKLKNVDLINGTILIANGKNCNIRLISLSYSMLNTLKEYLTSKYINKDDYIFSTKNHSFISNSQIENIFRKTINNCKLGIDAVNRPRIHDFRHSFAIKTLDKMYEKGYDYYTTLPILSKYMGHNDITHTEYYLRLTKYYHYKVIDKEKNIIPEIIYDK